MKPMDLEQKVADLEDAGQIEVEEREPGTTGPEVEEPRLPMTVREFQVWAEANGVASLATAVHNARVSIHKSAGTKFASQVAWQDAMRIFLTHKLEEAVKISRATINPNVWGKLAREENRLGKLEAEARTREVRAETAREQAEKFALELRDKEVDSTLPLPVSWALQNLYRIPDVEDQGTWAIQASEAPDAECWAMLLLAAENRLQFTKTVMEELTTIRKEQDAHQRALQLKEAENQKRRIESEEKIRIRELELESQKQTEADKRKHAKELLKLKLEATHKLELERLAVRREDAERAAAEAAEREAQKSADPPEPTPEELDPDLEDLRAKLRERNRDA